MIDIPTAQMAGLPLISSQGDPLRRRETLVFIYILQSHSAFKESPVLALQIYIILYLTGGAVPAFAVFIETSGPLRKRLCNDVSKHIPGVLFKMILPRSA